MFEKLQMKSFDRRKSLRIKEDIRVHWNLPDKSITGEGRIVNVSTSGMLLETQTEQPPTQNINLEVTSPFNHTHNFIPHSGRIVWTKKNSNQRNRFLWGIEFDNPPPEALKVLKERIQVKIEKLTNVRKIKTVVGYSLYGIFLILSFVMIREYYLLDQETQKTNQMLLDSLEKQATVTTEYFRRYRDTESQLKEKEELLAKTTEELNNTQKILSETQSILSLVKTENQKMQQELQGIEEINNTTLVQMQESFDKNVTDLAEKNSQYSKEITDLKERIRFFEGNIKNIDEGKAFLSLYHNKIHLVKRQIHVLKREIHKAKIAAFKELDRLRLLQGNRGYVIKDGQILPPVSLAKQPSLKEIDIDVTFFK